MAAAGAVLAARPRAGWPVSARWWAACRRRLPAASTACPPPTGRCCWDRRRSTTRTAATGRWTAETLDHVFDAAQRLVPSIAREHAIKTFASNRPASDPTYRIAVDAEVANLVHAAGIRSTGVSSSPAVAEMVRGLLEGLGLPVGDQRPDAITELEPLPRLLGHPRPEQLFARDPRYGQVICACEQVTAAEIAAVHGMAVPPTSLEGVPQAHPCNRRSLPGRVLPVGRLVPALAARRPPPAADCRLGARRDAGRRCARCLTGRRSRSSARASPALPARMRCATSPRSRSSTASRCRAACTAGRPPRPASWRRPAARTCGWARRRYAGTA